MFRRYYKFFTTTTTTIKEQPMNFLAQRQKTTTHHFLFCFFLFFSFAFFSSEECNVFCLFCHEKKFMNKWIIFFTLLSFVAQCKLPPNYSYFMLSETACSDNPTKKKNHHLLINSAFLKNRFGKSIFESAELMQSFDILISISFIIFATSETVTIFEIGLQR